jgi:transposase
LAVTTTDWLEDRFELLCTITGVQRRTAEHLIAEIGVDMSIFPTAKELASWVGQCPANHQSAGKRRSGRTRNGSKRLMGTRRSRPGRDTLQRHLSRRAIRPAAPTTRPQKALGAVKHSIIVACWHMLCTGEIYNDLGDDYFQRRDPAKTTKRLVAQLERLGHTVTLQEVAA